MSEEKKEVRFSMNHLTKVKMGNTSNGNMKSNRSTKRSQKKSGGKYEVKIVDGVKYMRLKDY